GARAADPAGEPPVRGDKRPVAALRRRGRVDPNDGGEHVRAPLGGESPCLDQHLVRFHSASPASASACHTLSGVRGMSMLRIPACWSASTTALTYAAGEPTVADSPTPLAPSGWCGEGVTVSPSSNVGVSQAVGSR